MQNDEIKRQVDRLMQNRIIDHSSWEYNIPVLLVRKNHRIEKYKGVW